MLLALALLKPGGEWVPLDLANVIQKAGFFPDEAAFRARFERRFGRFALPDPATLGRKQTNGA